MTGFFRRSGVPGAAQEHRDDTFYEKDYWQAYDEAWRIAWLCACSDRLLSGSQVAARSQETAHAIATDFAEIQQCWRLG